MVELEEDGRVYEAGIMTRKDHVTNIGDDVGFQMLQPDFPCAKEIEPITPEYIGLGARRGTF